MTYIIKPLKKDKKPSLHHKHTLSTELQKLVLFYADIFTVEEMEDSLKKAISIIKSFQEETE